MTSETPYADLPEDVLWLQLLSFLRMTWWTIFQNLLILLSSAGTQICSFLPVGNGV